MSVSHPRLAEIHWRYRALVASMGVVALPRMPLRTASALTFVYALGYPIGALAVSAMSPMGVLVFRFGLAAAILSGWALVARVTWPTGRTLVHVLISGLLAQGAAVHLPVPGPAAWRPRGVGRRDRLDEPSRHRGVGGDVPR